MTTTTEPTISDAIITIDAVLSPQAPASLVATFEARMAWVAIREHLAARKAQSGPLTGQWALRINEEGTPTLGAVDLLYRGVNVVTIDPVNGFVYVADPESIPFLLDEPEVEVGMEPARFTDTLRAVDHLNAHVHCRRHVTAEAWRYAVQCGDTELSLVAWQEEQFDQALASL